uniref:Uncharacterized protein n=1 Tax=Oryza glumipatula TaxID=40148 RepID=A0A0E0A925_9ORYZ
MGGGPRPAAAVEDSVARWREAKELWDRTHQTRWNHLIERITQDFIEIIEWTYLSAFSVKTSIVVAVDRAAAAVDRKDKTTVTA